MRTRFAALVLSTLILVGSRPANAALVVDTGTPNNSAGWWLSDGQFFAGEFTLSSPSTINSIEGYFNASNGGTLEFAIHANGGVVPDAILHTTSASYGNATPLDWHGVSGLNWALGAGTYWVSFKPSASFSGTMPGYAPNPLAEYSQASGNYAWQDYWGEDFFDYLDVGVRIDATAAVVPEPASLVVWSLLGLTVGGAAWWRRRAK